MTFLAARKAARILIRSLRHRHDLPLTRPAVSSRGGLTRHERAAEIEPRMTSHLHRRTRILILILMPMRTFLAIAPAIFLNTLVPSLSLEKSHHREKNRNENSSCVKLGTGTAQQANALTFKTHPPIELREQLQLSLLC